MYRLETVRSFSEAIPLVASFAAEVGWQVTGGNTFKHPGEPTGEAFVLSATGDELSFSPLVPGSGKPSAVIKQPHLFQYGVVDPSKVYMFCSLAPEPYIALAFEFGDLTFRHLYFGHMEKRGGYTGGEVLSACAAEHSDVTRSPYERHPHQYLFRAMQSRRTALFSGGVRVQHAGNANTWRVFRSTLQGISGLNGSEVVGGFLDGPAGGFMAFGFSAVGRHMTSPIELSIPRNIGGPTELSPIGRVPGVRHVNMQNYTAADQIDIGGKKWRVFPAFRKANTNVAAAPPSLPNFPVSESSYFVGYAYAES